MSLKLSQNDPKVYDVIDDPDSKESVYLILENHGYSGDQEISRGGYVLGIQGVDIDWFKCPFTQWQDEELEDILQHHLKKNPELVFYTREEAEKKLEELKGSISNDKR